MAKDISPYNETGTIVGSPLWGNNGKRGGAYSFVTNGHILIHDADRYTLSGRYTVAVWINPNNIGDRTKAIMGTYDGTYGFFLYLDNTANNKLGIWAGATTVNSNYPIAEDGNRKHVAYVRSGAL